MGGGLLKRLRELREGHHFSQIRLATELFVSQETISGYELGKAVPPLDILKRLADLFHTSTDYLLERTDRKTLLQTSDLSESEAEMLLIIRRQNTERSAVILEMLRGLE